MLPSHRNAHQAHHSGRFKDLRAATETIVRLGRQRRARRKKLSDFARWVLHGF